MEEPRFRFSKLFALSRVEDEEPVSRHARSEREDMCVGREWVLCWILKCFCGHRQLRLLDVCMLHFGKFDVFAIKKNFFIRTRGYGSFLVSLIAFPYLCVKLNFFLTLVTFAFIKIINSYLKTFYYYFQSFVYCYPFTFLICVRVLREAILLMWHIFPPLVKQYTIHPV